MNIAASTSSGSDPALIGYVQLSDAPLVGKTTSYLEEAMFHRMVPGEGELPLRAILAAVPAEVVMDSRCPCA